MSSLSINVPRHINYHCYFGELAFMDEKQEKDFQSFLDGIYVKYMKDREMESIIGETLPEERLNESRRCIMSRLKAVGNLKVELIIGMIMKTKSKDYAPTIKKEINHTIMGYDTKIRKFLPSWSISDFEDMHTVLYGQESEE